MTTSDQVAQHYEYSRIDFCHPDPALDLTGVVSINIVVDGESIVSGNDVGVV